MLFYLEYRDGDTFETPGQVVLASPATRIRTSGEAGRIPQAGWLARTGWVESGGAGSGSRRRLRWRPLN
jgi:hypothetical protein